MLPPNDYVLLTDYKLNKLPGMIAKAEQHRLLAEAGLLQRSQFSCAVCRSLWRLGHVLVVAGVRLERHYAPLTPRPALS